MNGPGHFADAQFYVETAQAEGDLTGAICGLTHAVLALVAATVDNDAEHRMGPTQLAKWARVGATA